jgi:hypothetical protein
MTWWQDTKAKRSPDFVHRAPDGRPIFNRWHLVPRNTLVNVYLHEFVASDSDPEMHDHPYANVSYILEGRYIEERMGRRRSAAKRRYWVPKKTGDLLLRWPSTPHRILMRPDETCWSLFVTGPRVRQWGFHCTSGWVPWKKYVDRRSGGGSGCVGK